MMTKLISLLIPLIELAGNYKAKNSNCAWAICSSVFFALIKFDHRENL